MSELAKKLVEVLGITAAEELITISTVAGVTVSGATATLGSEIRGIIDALPEKKLQDWLNAKQPALVTAFKLSATATLAFDVKRNKSSTADYPRYDVRITTNDYGAASRESEIRRTLFDILKHDASPLPVKPCELADVAIKVA